MAVNSDTDGDTVSDGDEVTNGTDPQVPYQPFMVLADTIEEFDLPGGLTNSLTSNLNGAEKALDNGDIAGACDKLASLINEINAQDGTKLTTEQAAD